MPTPRYEVPVGSIDGVNAVFTTVAAYVPGSTAVFLNGQLKRIDFEDGWVETMPSMGIFTMKEIPRVGDVVQLFYLDATVSLFVVEEVCGITGNLIEEEEFSGVMEEDQDLTGVMEVCDEP